MSFQAHMHAIIMDVVINKEKVSYFYYHEYDIYNGTNKKVLHFKDVVPFYFK